MPNPELPMIFLKILYIYSNQRWILGETNEAIASGPYSGGTVFRRCRSPEMP